MSLFDTLIVQPIFNLLALIYGLLPGSDFGISLILFTIIIRLLMWPLVKKQLHQTKLMRSLQPELKQIRKKTKGNKQLEVQLSMELYRERGIKPASSFGLLLLQLPIFIALYHIILIITTKRNEIEEFTYSWVENLKPISDIINDSAHRFDGSFLHIIDLTKASAVNGSLYWPAIAIALIAGGLQYLQSRQVTPRPESNQKLRDTLRPDSKKEDFDQTEVMAALMNRMILILPIMTFMFSFTVPSALLLYFAASSAVAAIQQHFLLREDVEEMEVIADMDTKDMKKSSTSAKKRAASATEATITSSPKKAKKKKRRR